MTDNWYPVKDGDPRAVALYERHYSCYKPKNRKIDRVRYGFSGNGESLILLTQECRSLFCWRKVKGDGILCSVFRNENSDLLSSELIKEACLIAWKKWPDERLFTFINPKKIKSSNPGCCFLKAGWKKCGMTKGGLIVLEAYP